MAAQVKWELRRIPTCPHARAYYDDLGVDAHPALTGRAQHLARFSEPRILREPEQLRTCPVCRPVYAEVAIGASSRPRAPCAPPRNDSSPYRLTALPAYRLIHPRHIPRDGSSRPQDDQPAQDSDSRQQEHGTVEAEPVRQRSNERKRDGIANQMDE